MDNTFATPILCKPFEFGADIVTHSTSKYMDGHALQIGGVIVDSGNFNWDNGNFPELVEPDPSYHGLSYTKTYGKQAYILKARMQLMRDFWLLSICTFCIFIKLRFRNFTCTYETILRKCSYCC